MADEKKFEQILHFALFFFIPVFDKEANTHCSIGSITRPISSHDHNLTDQATTMDKGQSYFRKLDNHFLENNKLQ